jgi:hypothetical protein
LSSPALTGVPTAPTASPGTNTTQLATTAFVDSSFIGFGAVVGPAVATNNAIALFNGTSGKIIKDSTVLLTSLAPLASPALTGTPTAPTAGAGTNTTQIASTAFVTAAIAAPAATASSFSAHNNGTNQSIPNAAFTTVNLSTTVFNNGSNFAANAWTPPAGRPIMLSGAVQLVISGTGIVLATIYKNGTEFKRGVQHSFTGLGISGLSATVSIVDIPNGTDVYTLRVFQNVGVAQNTDGTAAMTWFQGTTIQS